MAISGTTNHSWGLCPSTVICNWTALKSLWMRASKVDDLTLYTFHVATASQIIPTVIITPGTMGNHYTRYNSPIRAGATRKFLSLLGDFLSRIDKSTLKISRMSQRSTFGIRGLLNTFWKTNCTQLRLTLLINKSFASIFPYLSFPIGHATLCH